MTDSRDAALKIMALVDESPSEPFSLERKWLVEKLETIIANHTQQIDNERDVAFFLGVEEAEDSMRRELSDNYELRIEELENQIADLNDKIKDLEDSLESRYIEGVSHGLASRDN